MKILVAAVGRLKDAPEAEIVKRYRDRVDALSRQIGLGPVSSAELTESRLPAPAERKREEAVALLRRAPAGYRVAALDETGDMLSSAEFAAWLRGQRDEGVAGVMFAIGGPDGHGPAIRNGAARILSLSTLTLAHALARVVLYEQLYRAASILAGHPYHRA
jgi:23S rRNA (pseudouridine1915-N3)-methyltransferase